MLPERERRRTPRRQLNWLRVFFVILVFATIVLALCGVMVVVHFIHKAW